MGLTVMLENLGTRPVASTWTVARIDQARHQVELVAAAVYMVSMMTMRNFETHPVASYRLFGTVLGLEKIRYQVELDAFAIYLVAMVMMRIFETHPVASYPASATVVGLGGTRYQVEMGSTVMMRSSEAYPMASYPAVGIFVETRNLMAAKALP